MKNRIFSFLVLVLLLMAWQTNLPAQQTSATLSGKIVDETNLPMPGVNVQITFLPLKKTSATVTNEKGGFYVPNLSPGGPYSITISFIGYKTENREISSLSLGANTEILVRLLPESKEIKGVEVVGRSKVRNEGTVIKAASLQLLPSTSHSLQDFTRMTPESNNNAYAGTNFRYNNITLDGAVNNDAISFSNSFGGVSGGGQSGTAGAGSRSNPYSIDYIEQVQVQISPFDIKQGNFTGGSINAVTKSGTNETKGDLYAFTKQNWMVGSDPTSGKSMPSSFYDGMRGFSLSGAIRQNKLFYFVNAEQTRRQDPSFYNAGDAGSPLSTADAQAIVNQLKTKYNYDPGSFTDYNIQTNSDKLFGRLDYIINAKNSLMVRAIYTHGWGQNLERSTTNFQFGSTDFTQHTKNLSIIGQLKSTFSNNLYNDLMVSYIHVHDYRDFPNPLAPFIDIASGKIWLGTWREASIYNTKQQTVEFTDNLTWIKGIHTFTLGTHNEFYSIDYGFLNSYNGRWEYSSVANFLADKPSRIRSAYPLNAAQNSADYLTAHPDQIASFHVNFTSLYLQDEINFEKLKLSPGIRVDYPFVSKQPGIDPALNQIRDVHTANTYANTSFKDLSNQFFGKATFSPRLGFNFDLNGDKSLVLSGGTGIFSGRIPLAWLGYAYTFPGTKFANIDVKPSGTKAVVPLVMDPSQLKSNIEGIFGTSASATREIDVVDNNFKMPEVWRSNLAVDVDLKKGYKLTLEGFYTQVINDVMFQNINIKDSAAVYLSSGPVSSPIYKGGKNSSSYSNIYLLTNTHQGYRYNYTVKLSKLLEKRGKFSGLINLAYTHGLSKDISNGIRNSWQSNYEVNPSIVPNNPELAYSNFDLRNRIVTSWFFNFDWNDRNKTSVGIFHSSQSGSPYSATYSTSPNPYGNSSNANLIYIPKNSSELIFADVTNGSGAVTYSAADQSRDFNQFIDNDKYLSKNRGKYAERNGLRTPWNHFVDLQMTHEFKFKIGQRQQSIQLLATVFNFLNLLSNNWGKVYFITNVNNYTIPMLAFANDANKVAPGSTGYIPTFNFLKYPDNNNSQYYTVDPVNSRWQIQLGLKYNF
ncbi:MAG: carboxypeptidase regulatory-like domain-containing protein [Marinilabiliales bacterium]|nr:carboxypeptidase regulatory-like domain-containing protein [Marinilabiliales bacterium]